MGTSRPRRGRFAARTELLVFGLETACGLAAARQEHYCAAEQGSSPPAWEGHFHHARRQRHRCEDQGLATQTWSEMCVGWGAVWPLALLLRALWLFRKSLLMCALSLPKRRVGFDAGRSRLRCYQPLHPKERVSRCSPPALPVAFRQGRNSAQVPLNAAAPLASGAGRNLFWSLKSKPSAGKIQAVFKQ